MVKKRVDVEVPDGQHLGFSRGTEGAKRAHLFDDETNQLVGHAELFEVDEDDEDEIDAPAGTYSWAMLNEDGSSEAQATEDSDDVEEFTKALATLVALGIAAGVVKAAPYIKRWLDTKGRPAIESTWNRLAKVREIGQRAVTAGLVATVKIDASDDSTEDGVALEVRSPTMSSAEAQKRFLAMMMASAFAAEQMRALSTARIEEDDPMRRVVGQLTTQRMSDEINRMLAANPSLLDEGSSAAFMKIFGGGRIIAGQYVPVRLERIKDALRLPGDVM